MRLVDIPTVTCMRAIVSPHIITGDGALIPTGYPPPSEPAMALATVAARAEMADLRAGVGRLLFVGQYYEREWGLR